MNQLASMSKDACSPCLSVKEIKKHKEQELKDLKSTINYLTKHHGYDREVSQIIGVLLTKLVNLSGPLK